MLPFRLRMSNLAYPFTQHFRNIEVLLELAIPCNILFNVYLLLPESDEGTETEDKGNTGR